MKFLNIVKKILSIGAVAVPVILNGISPGLGALVGTVLNSVLQAEANVGNGKGEEKRHTALSSFQVAAPAVVALIESQTGKQLEDEVLFAEGIEMMQEGIVKILNAFRVLPKS